MLSFAVRHAWTGGGRELQAATDAKELEELKEACTSPVSEGIAFATKRLEATRTDLKQQFKEVFQELKEALEVRISCLPPFSTPVSRFSSMDTDSDHDETCSLDQPSGPLSLRSA